jgi:tetratricopeptide (TPR) repeat protein
MRFPFDELELENRLQALQIALLRSGGKRRRILTPEEGSVRNFGKSLFNALLVGEIRSRYDISQREAALQGKGLRIKLRIQPPELSALPWEFLYDPRQEEYICLSRYNPLVRYLEIPQPDKPFTAQLPLRILGMIAAPDDLHPLDVPRERERIEKAVHNLRLRGMVELTWLDGETWRDLQRALQGGPWHVFHFIGHGGYDQMADEGVIALSNEQGLGRFMSATQLGRLLADHPSLRLALLNACEGARGSEKDIFSSTAATLVRRGIPAVIAMQYEITDRTAIEFARAFYEALANGMPVDAAVAEARKAVSLAVNNTIEWGTPVLYLRSPDGRVFDLPGQVSDKTKRPAKADLPEEGLLERNQRLEQLYNQGLEAFYTDEWELAVRCFQAILDEQPAYPEVQEKLDEADRRANLANLRRKASAARDAGDWDVALASLQALAEEIPDDLQVRAELREGETQKRLKDLYADAQQLYEAGHWEAVLNVFSQIDAIDPEYDDPGGLLPVAQEKVAERELEVRLETDYNQALQAMDRGDWEMARDQLRQVKELDPDYKGPYASST